MEYIERVKESTIEVVTDDTAHCNIIKHSIDGIVYKGNPIRYIIIIIITRMMLLLLLFQISSYTWNSRPCC